MTSKNSRKPSSDAAEPIDSPAKESPLKESPLKESPLKESQSGDLPSRASITGTPSFSPTQFRILLGIALVLGVTAIVWNWKVWTKKKAIPGSDAAEVASGASTGSSKKETSSEGTSPGRLGARDPSPGFAAATVKLPKEAVGIEVAPLQEELKRLGHYLETTYPDRADALHGAAMIASELGQSERAEGLWRKSTSLKPNEIGPYLGLAKVLSDRGLDEEAIGVLSEARKGGRVTEQLIRDLGSAYSKTGEVEQAVLVLQDGVRAYPRSADMWLQLSIELLQDRKAPEAEDAAKKALALGASNNQALLTLANALARQEKREEAAEVRKFLKSETEGDANDKEGSSAKPAEATVSTVSGDAVSKFQVAYSESLKRIAVTMFTLAGSIDLRAGKSIDGEQKLLRAIAIAPEDLTTYMELSAAYRKENRLPDALVVHQRLLELQPNNVLNYINFASVAIAVGDVPAAEKALTKATEVAPSFALPFAELSRLKLVAGDGKGAWDFARKARDLEPNNAEWHIMTAAAAKSLGMVAEAEAELTAAVRIAPNDPNIAAAVHAVRTGR